MNVLLRISTTSAVFFGAAIITAVSVAVLDIYLTGNGYSSILAEIISLPAWGMHLSAGDLLMFVVALVAGAVAWRLLRPQGE